MISTGGGGDSVFPVRLDWSPLLHQSQGKIQAITKREEFRAA